MGVLATLALSPLEHLSLLFDHYQKGIDQCQPVGEFITDKRAVFTFVHCAETKQEAIESGALEATLWFMNMQHEVYSVPRKEWLQSIREKSVIWANSDAIKEWALAAERKAGELPAEDEEALDFDDPVPVISLMNRQRAGHDLDPLEIYEALDPFDAVIIGDVDTCRRKFESYAAIGVDNLMCLMQMAPLPHEIVMRSIRTTGEYLVPELAKIERPRSGPAQG
jgi:alkanesulfonate monooxygenase SsuD/methylene tetrahydromethanopterin reductase-like flavin-dependent oxidoreductase (luciferase family)